MTTALDSFNEYMAAPCHELDERDAGRNDPHSQCFDEWGVPREMLFWLWEAAMRAAAQPWINVKDRLPDADRQLVVVFDPEHPELKVWPAQWDAENQAFLAGHYPSAGWFEKDEVTHWMPLQDKP